MCVGRGRREGHGRGFGGLEGEGGLGRGGMRGMDGGFDDQRLLKEIQERNRWRCACRTGVWVDSVRRARASGAMYPPSTRRLARRLLRPALALSPPPPPLPPRPACPSSLASIYPACRPPASSFPNQKGAMPPYLVPSADGTPRHHRLELRAIFTSTHLPVPPLVSNYGTCIHLACFCAQASPSQSRCSRVFPCASCVKKGCAAICPDGLLLIFLY